MALGNSGSATDSPVLVVVSAVAIAIVFVLIMLLIVLRARHMALQRQEAMRLREQWETQLILRFKDKPEMHQVWLSSGVRNKHDSLHQDQWNQLVPLFAVDNRPTESLEPPTYSVGVLLQLPQQRPATQSKATEDWPSSPQNATLSGSELLFGLSTLTAVERQR